MDSRGREELTYYMGMLPYEIYVLCGVYVGILFVVWAGNAEMLRVALLPVFMAYCVFGMSRAVSHPCGNGDLRHHIGHTECMRTEYFPCGTSGVAAALIVALVCEIVYKSDLNLFGIHVSNVFGKAAVLAAVLLIEICVLFHRVNNRRVTVFDACTGLTVGALIGLASWWCLRDVEHLRTLPVWWQILVTIPIVALIWRFLRVQLPALIRHHQA